MSDSFLRDAVELVTGAWVKQVSLVSLPPLRMGTGRPSRAVQRHRDIFILAMLSVSGGMVILFHLAQANSAHFWTVAIAAAAFYRCLDIFFTLIRTGTFLSFRGDVQLNEEPTWRVQRILLGVLINYVELILWFSIIYRQLSLTSACQFAEPITSMDQAFNLSFSTMTTIGYGKYGPNGVVSDLIAFWQVLIGVILLVLVVGSILALITGSKAATGSGAGAGATRDGTALPNVGGPTPWLLPAGAFTVIWIGLFWFLSLHFCPPERPTVILSVSTVRLGNLASRIGNGLPIATAEVPAFNIEPLHPGPTYHTPNQLSLGGVQHLPERSGAARSSRRHRHRVQNS